MNPPIDFVLWEDSRGVTKDFGPHALALACVADEFRIDRWALRDWVLGIPKNGAHKLLTAFRRDAIELSRRGESVIAVLDHDRAGELVGLDSTACRSSILERINAETEGACNRHLVLLEANVETLVTVAGTVTEALPTLIQRACFHKDINARDRILHRAAEPHFHDRRRILDELRSLRRLVDLLTRLLRACPEFAALLPSPHSQ